MMMYTTRNKYCIILILTTIIFVFVNIIVSFIVQKTVSDEMKEHEFLSVLFQTSNLNQKYFNSEKFFTFKEVFNSKENISQNQNKNNQLIEWKIVIPKIGLFAPIREGTSQNIIKSSVGHFENSCMWTGNVALAAHNRGYKYSFFQNLKILKLGDEIIYITKYGQRKYKVKIIEKIVDTDWSYLKDTGENKITLITCIEDTPGYRLCVQGTEV